MKKKIELSARMQAVADFVSTGNRVCDVGCDHGYVSLYLVQEKIAPKVLAMDVNRGPLLHAKEHVAQYGMEDYITLRLSDGLTAYQIGEADTLICAGMGGRLLQNILSKEPEKTADFKELILQPQSEIGLFRKFLRKEGYQIVSENMIFEDGKFYPMMKVCLLKDGRQVKKADETDSDEEMMQQLEDNFGPCLLREKNPVLFKFIQQEISVKETILAGLADKEANEKITKRKKELAEELALLKKAEEQFS